MTLIKSISGIRGTIGGKTGDNLTPIDAVKFASAYGTFIVQKKIKKSVKTVIIGRDARISGKMISNIVANTLIAKGINVIDIGLSTTPTVEIAVPLEKADGGIIITASHNPKQWNALKLLNEKGEFINQKESEEVLKIAEKGSFSFAEIDKLGTYIENNSYVKKHIEEVLNLDLVDVEAIKNAKFKVVVDAVNSTGGIFIPSLLKKLKVECVELNCIPNGQFSHNPELLKEHLTDLSKLVVTEKADFGIAVDPDVDRLALICNDGSMFDEEYTLVACSDYVLEKNGGGSTVSNLSSTRALKDITQKHGGTYIASAVGEVNVVAKMKETKAVIGGEGNGGVIYPEAHYGRDSLVGVALFLSLLSNKKITCRELRNLYPNYFMSKNKIQLTPEIDVDKTLEIIASKYKNEELITIDGVKIDFAESWIHLRKSNTEPIIRIYTEAKSQQTANKIAEKFIEEINSIIC